MLGFDPIYERVLLIIETHRLSTITENPQKYINILSTITENQTQLT